MKWTRMRRGEEKMCDHNKLLTNMDEWIHLMYLSIFISMLL